ncbi:MAG: HAMP domain-containing histidine kinase [Rhodospirillales bacterium]|nr:HAMP domain-containing histidine kinase [Rhodospirillales bacterium]
MSGSEPRKKLPGIGLSARLLLLTITFVMVSEFLIYAPSISRFRKVYLEEMIAEAHLAALALEATADAMVSEDLENELLFHAGAYAIVLNRTEKRLLALSKDMPPKVDATLDLRDMAMTDWLPDAFAAMFRRENRVIRVIAISPKEPDVVVEVVMDEAVMREEMYGYSTRILELSIVISLITAGAVYFSLQLLLVRPMRRITRSMAAFQEDPEDVSRIIAPSKRNDEMGRAEQQLAVMQQDLNAALHQKTRLAALGAAVAKVNHDLRNSLSTAMLVHDRLADIDDPDVKQVTPRLFNAIDHAVNLCSQTLNYVGDGAAKVEKSLVNLHSLVLEVEDMLRMFCEGDAKNQAIHDLKWHNRIDPALELEADGGQLMRIFENLVRNSGQAAATEIVISAIVEGERVIIEFSDDGPGLPDSAKENIFQPFAGSARAGGTGLGLVIVREVVRGHGGEIELSKSDTSGATFRIELPVGNIHS